MENPAITAASVDAGFLRRVKLSPNQHLIQHVCRERCRGFVYEYSTGARYAVHVSIFNFHRLSDDVSSKWLSEVCPGKRLSADEADRQARFSEVPFAAVADEAVNASGIRLVTVSKNQLDLVRAIDSIASSSRRPPRLLRTASRRRSDP